MLGAKSRDARIKAATSLLERILIFMTLVADIALSLRIFAEKRGSSCRRSVFISLARSRSTVLIAISESPWILSKNPAGTLQFFITSDDSRSCKDL